MQQTKSIIILLEDLRVFGALGTKGRETEVPSSNPKSYCQPEEIDWSRNKKDPRLREVPTQVYSCNARDSGTSHPENMIF